MRDQLCLCRESSVWLYTPLKCLWCRVTNITITNGTEKVYSSSSTSIWAVCSTTALCKDELNVKRVVQYLQIADRLLSVLEFQGIWMIRFLHTHRQLMDEWINVEHCYELVEVTLTTVEYSFNIKMVWKIKLRLSSQNLQRHQRKSYSKKTTIKKEAWETSFRGFLLKKRFFWTMKMYVKYEICVD